MPATRSKTSDKPLLTPSVAAATARCWSCRMEPFEARPAASMTSQSIATPVRPRGLLATPRYVRLWFAGGGDEARRLAVMLVAGVFISSGAAFAVVVAAVSAAGD